MSELQQVLVGVKTKIARYGARDVNEENTKTTLIQPVLRALGWDVEDIEDVHMEYRRRPRDKPVDFALMLLRTPSLFVEAKALGQNLNDQKWANQVLGYATVAGVEWVVLTDGNEYRIYNSHATVPAEEKLFRQIRITDDASKPEETLSLLAKGRMEEKRINLLWESHFVDRQVRTAVQDLFATDTDPDSGLLRLLRKRIPTLSAKDIKAGMRRLEIRIETLSQLAERPVARRDSQQRTKKKKEGDDAAKPQAGVSLSDLIQAGLLRSPLMLTRKYKGHELEAELVEDGTVVFQRKTYRTCSAAAEMARSTVTGRRMNTNGWTFWQHLDAEGKLVVLDEARQNYLKGKTSIGNGGSPG